MGSAQQVPTGSRHRNVLGLLGGIEDVEFEGPPDLRYTLKIRHGGLWLGPYTAYQEALFGREIPLREAQGLTFAAISDQLIAEGYTCLREKALSAESVFSIYEKRNVRDK